MKKKDLEAYAKIASSTIAKMSNELSVSMDVLGRICKTLQCTIGDIVEIIY
jgi:DNA-binding Xre family transcriptional regulator